MGIAAIVTCLTLAGQLFAWACEVDSSRLRGAGPAGTICRQSRKDVLMPDFPTIAFIGLAALGLALFWRGWRGRRIDNHPWCRKCRLDLKGLRPGAARCPECGLG